MAPRIFDLVLSNERGGVAMVIRDYFPTNAFLKFKEIDLEASESRFDKVTNCICHLQISFVHYSINFYFCNFVIEFVWPMYHIQKLKKYSFVTIFFQFYKQIKYHWIGHLLISSNWHCLSNSLPGNKFESRRIFLFFLSDFNLSGFNFFAS